MENISHIVQELKECFINYNTDTITFRPFTKADCFPLYVATKNQEFNSKLWWGPPENEDELMIEGLKLIRENELNQAVVLSVCDKYTGKWAGLIKFTPHEGTLTKSLWIHPDFWKSLIPLRCGQAAVEIIFRNTPLKEMYAIINKGNETMRKIVTHNFFIFVDEVENTHAKGYPVYGERFKLNKDDWKCRTKVFEY
jgi:RimJ/RimL family protein N-acetyltransferase